MKKMTSFMVMLLTAMVPVLFSSCGGNEPTPDSYEELIVGEWDCTRYDFDAEIDGEKEVGSAYPEPLEWVWKFSKTGVLSFPWYDKPDNITIEEETFRYEVEGDKLYSEYAMEAFSAQYFTIESITAEKMVLKLEFNYQHLNERGTYTFNFKRIK